MTHISSTDPVSVAMAELQSYLMLGPRARDRTVLAPVTTADGWTASVQASQNHYCFPRTDDGPWSAVEVGYPSAADPSLLPFADEPDRPRSTVYGYVPLDLVAEVLARRGGLVRRVEPVDSALWRPGDMATTWRGVEAPFASDVVEATSDRGFVWGGIGWAGRVLPAGSVVVVLDVLRDTLLRVLAGSAEGLLHASHLATREAAR
jgi:hypothetical protein